MSHLLIGAARAVASDFMPAELSVDAAAARTARLLATVLEQRAVANLSLGTGSALIRKLSKSLTAQIDAREEFAMAHKLAADLPGQLGLTETMFGDVVPCPPNNSLETESCDNVVRLAAV